MILRRFFLVAALSAAAFPALAAGASNVRNFAAAASPAPSAAATVAPSPAASALAGNAADGKIVFDTNCASCHGANAEGGYGPNIRGIGASIVTYTVRNPSARMGQIPLTDQQLADVAAYVSSLSP